MSSPGANTAVLKQKGRACLQENRLAEARQHYAAACELNPQDADAWHMLGSIHAMLGEFSRAEPCCRKALAIQPRHGGALYNLGVTLHRLGNPGAAIVSYRQALEQLPGNAIVHSSLGFALCETGELEKAEASCQRALAIDPNLAVAWNNLSIAQWAMGRPELAVDSCHKALSIKPDNAGSYNNLGNSLSDLSRFDEAEIAYKQAISLDPAFDEPHIGLGKLYNDTGEWQKAIDEYRRAIAINNENADAHFNMAWTLLLLGDFREGWLEYEWRLKLKIKDRLASFPKPLWDAGRLDGKTLFIQSEQGFGDAIQFIRYIPLVKQLGGKVIVECASELHALFSGCNDIDQIIQRGRAPREFDCYIPLPSLPRLFDTTLENIPVDIPYLSSPVDCPPDIKSLLAEHAGSKRIGLVWSGNPDFRRNHLRACPLELFKPLLDTPNTTFFSLQKGRPAADLEKLAPSEKIVPLGEKLHTFAETAAVLDELDLLIATDTSVPHLAGALGCKVWLLLSFAPDWRWLIERSDCPWYPSMRLFRQPQPGDWSSVINEVAIALAEESGNTVDS